MKQDMHILHWFIKIMVSPSFIFLKCFKDINNRSFHMDSQRGLTNLVFNGLCSSIKERLEHYEFLKF